MSLEQSPMSETTAVLTSVSSTMFDLKEAFTVLNSCTDQFTSFQSNSEATQHDIEACSQKIRYHEREMNELLAKIQSELVDDMKKEAVTSVRSKIGDLVRKEVTRQVKEQVDEQIKEHLLESLQHQADESKRQLEGIRISLQNSEARIQNSFIQTNDLMDPLAPILMTTGKKSPLYPSNARSLFNYDLESTKGLNRHYELTATDDLQMNFKQFLKHIGTGIDVAVSEEG